MRRTAPIPPEDDESSAAIVSAAPPERIGYRDPESELTDRLRQLRIKRRTLTRDNYRNLTQGCGFIMSRQRFAFWWAGYEISLDRDEIDTPEKCLRWLAEMGPERWPGMTPSRVAAMVRAMDRCFKWRLWG